MGGALMLLYWQGIPDQSGALADQWSSVARIDAATESRYVNAAADMRTIEAAAESRYLEG